jgi:uncharacterized membrane protein SpoIIM required for sporulation
MTKRRLTLILFLVFMLLLALTNPDQSRYEDWQEERWASLFDDGAAPAAKLSGSYIFENNTQKKNLWICSVFTTTMATRKFSYLGILGTFIPLQADDFLED